MVPIFNIYENIMKFEMFFEFGTELYILGRKLNLKEAHDQA